MPRARGTRNKKSTRSKSKCREFQWDVLVGVGDLMGHVATARSKLKTAVKQQTRKAPVPGSGHSTEHQGRLACTPVRRGRTGPERLSVTLLYPQAWGSVSTNVAVLLRPGAPVTLVNRAACPRIPDLRPCCFSPSAASGRPS